MKKYILFLLISTLSISVSQAKEEKKPVEADSIIMSYTAAEVVVQSFKRNDNLSQQPVSASLLTSQTIKDRNITNIKEMSAFIPNLFMPDYGSKMISPAYIRGIGSRINAPSVGLYVDGIPYFDRSTFDFDMNDVDRIEVLRGPQGTIYGRNTMGGIINIYTKSPFKYKETNVGLSAGNYNSYNLKASHYGNINNKFGYAISGNYMHTGGYINNVYTHKKADPMDAASTRIRLSWRAADQLFIHLTSAYEYSDQDGYAYGPYNDSTNHVGTVNYNAPSFYRRNMSTTGLNVQYSSDKIRFNSQSSFQYFDGKQGIDQDFMPEDIFYVLFGQRQRMYSQEFNLKSLGESNYQWLFGALGFHQEYTTDNHIMYIDPKYRGMQEWQDINTPSKGAALFHQSTFNNILTDRLSATLGIRYDWEEIRAHTLISSTQTNQPITEKTNRRDKETYSQLSPKATLMYKLTHDEIIYASVAKGYKSGGFNNTALKEEDLSFKPEQSWSYEVGAKASCFNKLIYTDISLFYIKWNDQQITQYQAQQGLILRNAGKSISKGLEVNLHINPLENMSIALGYGYTHAKFEKYNYSDNVSYTDNYLPMVPRHTFSAAANYTIKMKDKTVLDKIILNGQYAGLGKLYWREDNIASQPFYGTLNGQVSFVKNNMSIDLWAKNIADQNYVAFYFQSMGGAYAQRGKPFTCGVNLNVKF